METKICTSMYWKKQTRFMLIICFFIAVATVVFSIVYRDFEMFVVLGSCSAVYILVVFYTMFSVRRLLTDVFVNKVGFKSVVFNKKMATVNCEQTIYYAVFEEAQGAYSRTKFILISNSPFNYIPRRNIFSKSVLGRYDIHTQILLPYNSDTLQFCDLEKWTCVGC